MVAVVVAAVAVAAAVVVAAAATAAAAAVAVDATSRASPRENTWRHGPLCRSVLHHVSDEALAVPSQSTGALCAELDRPQCTRTIAACGATRMSASRARPSDAACLPGAAMSPKRS